MLLLKLCAIRERQDFMLEATEGLSDELGYWARTVYEEDRPAKVCLRRMRHASIRGTTVALSLVHCSVDGLDLMQWSSFGEYWIRHCPGSLSHWPTDPKYVSNSNKALTLHSTWTASGFNVPGVCIWIKMATTFDTSFQQYGKSKSSFVGRKHIVQDYSNLLGTSNPSARGFLLHHNAIGHPFQHIDAPLRCSSRSFRAQLHSAGTSSFSSYAQPGYAYVTQLYEWNVRETGNEPLRQISHRGLELFDVSRRLSTVRIDRHLPWSLGSLFLYSLD